MKLKRNGPCFVDNGNCHYKVAKVINVRQFNRMRTIEKDIVKAFKNRAHVVLSNIG